MKIGDAAKTPEVEEKKTKGKKSTENKDGDKTTEPCTAKVATKEIKAAKGSETGGEKQEMMGHHKTSVKKEDKQARASMHSSLQHKEDQTTQAEGKKVQTTQVSEIPADLSVGSEDGKSKDTKKGEKKDKKSKNEKKNQEEKTTETGTLTDSRTDATAVTSEEEQKRMNTGIVTIKDPKHRTAEATEVPQQTDKKEKKEKKDKKGKKEKKEKDDSKGDEKSQADNVGMTLVAISTDASKTTCGAAERVGDRTEKAKTSKEMDENDGDKAAGMPKRKLFNEPSTTASSESGNGKRPKQSLELVSYVKRPHQGVPTGCSPEKKKLKFDSESEMSGSEDEDCPEAT